MINRYITYIVLIIISSGCGDSPVSDNTSSPSDDTVDMNKFYFNAATVYCNNGVDEIYASYDVSNNDYVATLIENSVSKYTVSYKGKATLSYGGSLIGVIGCLSGTSKVEYYVDEDNYVTNKNTLQNCTVSDSSDDGSLTILGYFVDSHGYNFELKALANVSGYDCLYSYYFEK